MYYPQYEVMLSLQYRMLTHKHLPVDDLYWSKCDLVNNVWYQYYGIIFIWLT